MQKLENMPMVDALSVKEGTDVRFNAYMTDTLTQFKDILKIISDVDEHCFTKVSEDCLTFMKKVNNSMFYILELPSSSFSKYGTTETFYQYFKIKNLYKLINRFKNRFHIELCSKKPQCTVYESDEGYFHKGQYYKGNAGFPYRLQKYTWNFDIEIDKEELGHNLDYLQTSETIMNLHMSSGVEVDCTAFLDTFWFAMKGNKASGGDLKEICFQIKDNMLSYYFGDAQDTEFAEEVYTGIPATNNFTGLAEVKAFYDYELFYKVLAIFKKAYAKNMKSVKLFFAQDKPIIVVIQTEQYDFRFILAPIVEDEEDEDESVFEEDE